jgi:hypothetical protein
MIEITTKGIVYLYTREWGREHIGYLERDRANWWYFDLVSQASYHDTCRDVVVGHIFSEYCHIM